MDSVACDKITELGIALTKTEGVKERVIYTGDDFGDMFLEESSPNEFKVPTGINCIDTRMTEGGFRNRTLVTIAGRSSMGKTCFSMFMAHHIAKNHPAKRILFYSLEMTAVDILHKQVATATRKPIAHMTKSEKALGFRKAQDEATLVVYEKPLASIDYICTSARIASARDPMGVIVVDYVGIVQNPAKFESHALKMADVTAKLAGLAKELNCIVIALSQVNREYANRQDKRPLMSDAADSSGSERNSDVWLGIYRPSFDDDDPRLKGVFIVNCRKDRFGVPWEAGLCFDAGVFREPVVKTW
jgi:replicative DNA helicase